MTPLVYPKCTMPVALTSFEYNMGHQRTGHAIIFNHEEFTQDNTPPRTGSKLDANRLYDTLEALGFSVTVYHDLDSDKIKMRINECESAFCVDLNSKTVEFYFGKIVNCTKSCKMCSGHVLYHFVNFAKNSYNG